MCFRRLLLLLLLYPSPVFAYRSGNDIIIKRQVNHKPSLLDRKFIFMQEGAAYKKNKTTSSELKSLSQVPKSLPVKISVKPTTAKQSKKTAENIYDENNWRDYSELEESLSVSAKMR